MVDTNLSVQQASRLPVFDPDMCPEDMERMVKKDKLSNAQMASSLDNILTHTDLGLATPCSSMASYQRRCCAGAKVMR